MALHQVFEIANMPTMGAGGSIGSLFITHPLNCIGEDAQRERRVCRGERNCSMPKRRSRVLHAAKTGLGARTLPHSLQRGMQHHATATPWVTDEKTGFVVKSDRRITGGESERLNARRGERVRVAEAFGSEVGDAVADVLDFLRGRVRGHPCKYHFGAAACHSLPRCGRKAFQSAERVRLARQRRKLNRLHSFLSRASSNPHLLILHRHQLYGLIRLCGALVDPFGWGVVEADPHGWLARVALKLKQSRAAERGEVKKMKRFSRDRWGSNPAVYVRNMLKGPRHKDLRSVIDPTSSALVSEPDDVKHILRSHYQSLFAASARPSPQPAWVEEVYAPKEGIDPAWFIPSLRLMISPPCCAT